MKNILLVGAGGFIGSVARYLAGGWIGHRVPDAKFPLATFVVNVTGCLLAGIIAGFIERRWSHNADLRLLLMVGFLGGYTTFSAFGIETLKLIDSHQLPLAILYAAASVVCGIAAAWIGFRVI